MIKYDDLPTTKDGRHHAWDVHKGDERGCLALITDERVTEAAKEIRSGERVSLSVPLGEFTPALSGNRGDLEHVIRRTRSGGDDLVHNFYLQESSQWDGFAHVRYREYGFLGGREVEALEQGELGMDHMAPTGIIARGVLADIPGLWAARNKEWHPETRYEITTQDVEEALSNQNTTTRPGDVLLVRTGWVGWYQARTNEERRALAGTMTNAALPTAGLTQGDSFARWLWNNQIAAVAADNPALEAIPVPKGAGFLHRYLIPLLGIPIGELWALDALAETCARHNRWTFLLASIPLNLPKGVGSPNNAVAIF